MMIFLSINLQDVVRKIADLEVNPSNAVPVNNVKITDCGLVGIKKKYIMTQEVLEAEDEKFH